MIANLHASRADTLVIIRIAHRAAPLYASLGVRQTVMETILDLTACHLNGCELMLADLLAADDSNFVHDVFGIRRHIDRATGKLGDCFLPRFAVVCHEVRS